MKSVRERLGSDTERGLELKYCADVIDAGVGGECTAGDDTTPVGSSLSSIFMSLPCLELGGGGGFLAYE